MNKYQIVKILRLGLITTFIMFLFEILFTIPGISNIITQWVQNQNGWLIYGAIWFVMFIQATIIPIPSVTVLTASLGAGILNKDSGIIEMFGNPDTWLYIVVVLSAYMLGACVSYWIGRKWGKKAIQWCAGSDEEYIKWSEFITKKGKWPYAATVLLPIFPDDLLCLVAGSVKFDFLFFFFSNLIGRFIGLITMILTLILIGAGGGGWFTIAAWSVGLVAQLVLERILSYKIKREKYGQ